MLKGLLIEEIKMSQNVITSDMLLTLKNNKSGMYQHFNINDKFICINIKTKSLNEDSFCFKMITENDINYISKHYSYLYSITLKNNKNIIFIKRKKVKNARIN